MTMFHIVNALRDGAAYAKLDDKPLKGLCQSYGSSLEATSSDSSCSWSEYLMGEGIINKDTEASTGNLLVLDSISSNSSENDTNLLKGSHHSRKKKMINFRGGKVMKNLGGSMKSLTKGLRRTTSTPGHSEYSSQQHDHIQQIESKDSIFTTESIPIASPKTAKRIIKPTSLKPRSLTLPLCFCSKSSSMSQVGPLIDAMDSGALQLSFGSFPPPEYEFAAMGMPVSVGSM